MCSSPQTPLVDIEVTALGYYDADQDGLTLTDPVAIYDGVSQNQLAIADVDGSSFLDGSFRYTNITPITLLANQSYVVAGFHPGSGTEDFAAFPSISDITITSDIQFDGYSFSLGGTSVQFPDAPPDVNSTFFGPNFMFTETESQSVPESSVTLALLVLGGVGSIFQLKRGNI